MRARLRLVHPDFEIIDNNEDPQLERVLPVYLRSAGLSLSFMRKYAAQALAEYSGYILGRIPEAIVARHGLMGIAEALGNLWPLPDVDVRAFNDFSSVAHRTIIFEELFYSRSA